MDNKNEKFKESKTISTEKKQRKSKIKDISNDEKFTAVVGYDNGIVTKDIYLTDNDIKKGIDKIVKDFRKLKFYRGVGKKGFLTYKGYLGITDGIKAILYNIPSKIEGEYMLLTGDNKYGLDFFEKFIRECKEGKNASKLSYFAIAIIVQGILSYPS